jgi:hypothetical protein
MNSAKSCGDCGHKLEIHYKWFCPKCDVSAIEIGNMPVYDLFKLMYHMEANGFMSKDRYWRDYILESYNISNDIYIDAYFGDGDDPEINEYHAKVRELLSIDNEDSIIMSVSW